MTSVLWRVLPALVLIGSGSAAFADDTLSIGERLDPNTFLESQNLAYRFYLQGDGNLVLRRTSTQQALFSSATNGKGGVRFSMQGDGNAVLYTSNGAAVWSTQSNGSGANRLVMQNDGNLVLYTAQNRAVWATGTNTTDTGGGTDGGGNTGGGGTGGGSTGGGNGDNDGTATSSGRFSAPSAALYSLNSAKQRVFPSYVNSTFGGNGAAETWDGRVFVRTQTLGWFASAFRPQRITQNSDGTPNFGQGAFGTSLSLESNTQAPDMQHNWLAIVPDPAVTGENPYPSNASGSLQSSGTYRTYKALVYHTSLRNGDNDQMGLRKATFIVSNANTADAQLISAKFTTDFARLRLQSGADFRCIEPTVTLDGRLVVCQGHPNNDGRIDNLVYSWNSTPGATTNWRAPRSIANMYFDDRNTSVAGIPFRVRYPVAEKPLMDATGDDYASNELVKGAYPWISHDGSELFYQASRDGKDARRTGTSVVGRWTGGNIRHIDGPINRNRYATSRLFLSSPGAFTTMWTPYKDVPNLPIPYSVRGPSYPIFGSNSQDYSEVSFDDFLDGNYVMYLGMNEQLNRAGNFLVNNTPDTSGNFNNATLVGAKFPVEFNGRDELVGRYGQGIYFNAGNHLNVARTRGWDSLNEGVSVDMFVRKTSGSGTVRLFTLQSGVEVYLANGANLTAAIQDTAGVRRQINGPAIATGQWAHIAFTYSPISRDMTLYLNGASVATSKADGFGTLRTTGAVQVGPVSSTASLVLDEVKVSNVARRDYEIAHNANVRSHKAPSSALANTVPAHLRSLMNRATGVERFSLAAADLGEDLFNDVILSKQRTTSCSTCHSPSQSFTDGLDIARGNEPTDAGTRNTPSLFNRLFSSRQGWSGLSASLDKQALDPIQARHEMNLPIAEAVQRLSTEGNYRTRFQQVFGEGPTAVNLPIALASFQALQYAPKNRVDEFREGNLSVLSASERRGLTLFEGKARCSGCHADQNYTDESFRNNGIVSNGDIGRADVTGRNRDFKLFKVPSLREVSMTGPYMHDGSVSTLEEVVAAYNRGTANDPSIDTDIRPLELNSQEMSDLVAFLRALSGN